MSPKTLVERFFNDVWNRRDFAAARNIVSADFRFRGSLEPEESGIEGFLEYLESTHTAFGNHTCIINDLVLSVDHVAVRVTFRGTHQAEFLGVAATNKQIEWAGTAFFTVTDDKLSHLWLLGDMDAVKQLGASSVS